MKKTSCALLLALSMRAQTVSFSSHRIDIGQDTLPRDIYYASASADLNGDGRPDVVLAGARILVLPGKADGAFDPPLASAQMARRTPPLASVSPSEIGTAMASRTWPSTPAAPCACFPETAMEPSRLP